MTHAYEKKSYGAAAELYQQIAAKEPTQGDWLQRAGEALRQDGRPLDAAAQFAAAATRYAEAGFLLKAIAVCKLVLQIDPQHEETQARVAELYAARDGASAAIARAPIPTPAPPSTKTTTALSEVPLGTTLPSRRATVFSPPDEAAVADPVVSTPTRHAPAAYEIDLGTFFDEERAAPLLRLDDLGPLAAPTLPVKLPDVPLFSSLPQHELRHLIDRVVLRPLQAGERVMKQGDTGSSLFVVVEGELEVTLDGQPAPVGVLKAGDFFGELALLTDLPRSATVTARTAAQLFEIERALAWELIDRAPEVLRLLLQFFRDRMLERLFRTAPIFVMLSPEDARAMAARFVFLEVEPGVSLIKEGERSPGLFVLLCGAAEVIRGGQLLAQLHPGDVVGEMSLLSRAPAVASIVARGKCWLLELPAKEFQETALAYPQLLEYVSRLGGDRADENEIDLRLAAI